MIGLGCVICPTLFDGLLSFSQISRLRIAFMEILDGSSSGYLTLWLALTAVALLTVYWTWHYTYFLRRGIPGPLPLPIVGNTLGWRKGVQYALEGYVKKYGNCCGIYQFSSPVILVSDPDMIKQIMIKHFDRFHNRLVIPVDNPNINKGLFLSRDDQWKRIRHTLTPAFSARKLKLMSNLVRHPAGRLIENLRAACNKDGQGIVEFKALFGGYIMETIALCAFGLNVDSQNDPFVVNGNRFFASLDVTSPKMIILMVASMIPGATRILNWFGLTVFPPEVISFFGDIIDQAIHMRKTNKATRNIDFLQLIIDSSKGGEVDVDDDDDDDNEAVKSASNIIDVKRKREPLTRQELMSQALAFFFAGYETTTSALSFTAYLLATNPDQQDRLIDEIDRLAPTADDITYNNLKNFTFLRNCISESLRLYPPTTLVNRVCNETTTINGHLFQRGDAIGFPIWPIHRDPEYWPNPDTFEPDRFTKENQTGRLPLAWLPFGGGPRLCIGQRFAMMEIRTALVMILQEFRLEVAPETEIPPVLGKTAFLSPPNGVTLRIVERSK